MAGAVHTLGQQLSELVTLREEHAMVLQVAHARGRLRQAECDFRLGRLDAAIRTQQWLQANQDAVRAAAADPASSLRGSRP